MTDAPSGRTGAESAWTGSEMIVLGGLTSEGVAINGGIYAPATDAWRPLPLDGAPSARTGATVGWTGTAMVVWGGLLQETGDPALDGAAYDPARNVWRPLTPRPRSVVPACSVLAGQTLMAWGGADATGFVHDGDALDLSTNQWTRLPAAAGAPEVGAAGCTWTGSDLLLFGGVTIMPGSPPRGSNALGRLDPRAGTYRALATAGAPSARFRHVQAWTGRHLVVLGGLSIDGTVPRDGGRYDTMTDTWAPVGDAPVGSTRVAFWTGERVVTWGWDNDGTPVDAASSYDPITDARIPLPTIGQPPPRAGATGVWTGEELLVWGGVVAGSASAPGLHFLSDGARVRP